MHLISDNFDCEKDNCHLAWLLRDNRRLLAAVRNGRCYFGTEDFPFALIAPGLFSECPVCYTSLDVLFKLISIIYILIFTEHCQLGTQDDDGNLWGLTSGSYFINGPFVLDISYFNYYLRS